MNMQVLYPGGIDNTPGTNDGMALGSASLGWSDLYLASGGVINWANGDVTATHSSNALAFAGASNGYSFDAAVLPSSNDAAALGSASVSWADVFLASGGVINFNNGDVTITHSSNTLAFAGAATGYTFDSQVSITATDTTDVWDTSIDQVGSPLCAILHWNPASASTSVRFAIVGYADKISANGGTGVTHYGGVLGYAQKNNATGSDPFVVGIEGRVGALLGTITTAVAGVFTFDTNTEDGGSITIGIPVYIPDQSDAGHISLGLAIYNQYTAAPIRNNAVYQGADGSNTSPSYQFTNATGTGIYLSAANTLGLAGNGVLMMSIGSTVAITDAKNVSLGTGTGTKWGTATNQKQGWFNATPVVQQTDGAALTNNVTSGGTTDTIANFTSLTTYSTDAAAIRNNIYQLARKVKIVDDALRAYGLLS